MKKLIFIIAVTTSFASFANVTDQETAQTKKFICKLFEVDSVTITMEETVAEWMNSNCSISEKFSTNSQFATTSVCCISKD